MRKNRPKTTEINEKQGKTPVFCAKSEEIGAKTPDSAKKSYYEANKERLKASARERYANLSPADRAIKRWRGQAQPTLPRPGTKRAADPRKVALATAYCSWSDVEEVVRIYMACAILNELGWGHYQVAHIVPLSSYLVCGLHTHTNLTVLTYKENQVMGNHVWPGMPHYDWSTIDLLLTHP